MRVAVPALTAFRHYESVTFARQVSYEIAIATGCDVPYLGADWHFDHRTFAYLQARLAESDEDAVVVGLRYNF